MIATILKDTLTASQSIRDGDTLISTNETFELGFFSPGSSKNRYVGIWYYNISVHSVVWIANRDNPLNDSSGVFSIGNNGNLLLSDGRGNVFWSTDITSNSSIAVLKDSGNLILSTILIDNSERVLWQSFDQPTDTLLPGMQIGLNLRTGKRQMLTSWNAADDPSQGNVTIGIDPLGSAQIFIWRDSKPLWRSGDWNGQSFTGIPEMAFLYQNGFNYTNNVEDGTRYFTVAYSVVDIPRLILVITPEGKFNQLWWNEENDEWDVQWYQPANQCEIYGICGTFGSCSVGNSPICSCLEGFVPRSVKEWNIGNWSGGCVRRTVLQCGNSSSERGGFWKIKGVKLPDLSDSIVVQNEQECEAVCHNNCSCRAYAYVSGIGCMKWGSDLMDIQQFAKGGNDLYYRVDGSELGGKSKISKTVIIILIIVGVIFSATCIYILCRFKAKLKGLWSNEMEAPMFDLGTSGDISGSTDGGESGKHRNGPELALFNFNHVAAATNNFSDANKVGQGGFGAVYKGKLSGGQEIAVKRLSKMSGQGSEEFKNEVILIVKLQHRNLVRLLGCCIQGEERMLLYEYMPNKSLDSFIFDPTKQGLLDWKKRFNIIEGIALGLLYLHRDSRLRIIHRDLKASNILLDEEMNPKISDFGMAKIFGGNQNQANTNRVVGTYGYMSPEYAMGGLISVKSDVYSFGVLLLEIVSGKKNTSFYNSEHYLNLLEYAWKLWKENKAIELMDPSLGDSCSMHEVLRCVHVGLLCVQDHAIDRPTMASVVLMLGSELATCPTPSQPTFTMNPKKAAVTTKNPKSFSTNDATVSVIVGR